MTRALIAGAGIAGPVTAMALQRAGIESTVYEAHDRTADGVGAFLTLAINGLHALGHVGIGPATLGGFDTPAMSIRSCTGRRLATFASGRPGSPFVSRTLSRSDLYARLRDEAVARGIRIEYGKQLVDSHSTPVGAVWAEFADGTSAEGNVLIGADGLHSRTRILIDPSCPEPRYTGLLNTGGYAQGVTVTEPDGQFTMMFGKKAFFGYLQRRPGDVWWFANIPAKKPLSSTDLAGHTPDRWRAELTDRFAGDAGPATDIISATEHIVLPWNTCDLPHVDRWSSRSTVLIGDAAHAISPSSGQGASLAVEDGVMLARCLRDSDIPSALRTFERLRRGRVQKLIARAKRTSDMKIANPMTRVVRDRLVMPLVARSARNATDRPDWIQDYRIEWDDPAHGGA